MNRLFGYVWSAWKYLNYPVFLQISETAYNFVYTIYYHSKAFLQLLPIMASTWPATGCATPEGRPWASSWPSNYTDTKTFYYRVLLNPWDLIFSLATAPNESNSYLLCSPNISQCSVSFPLSQVSLLPSFPKFSIEKLSSIF